MTLEDSWGGDIVTAAIAHLAHSTPPELLFTATDFNSYVTVSIADGAPQRANGRMAASHGAGPGRHAADGGAGQAGGGGRAEREATLTRHPEYDGLNWPRGQLHHVVSMLDCGSRFHSSASRGSTDSRSGDAGRRFCTRTCSKSVAPYATRRRDAPRRRGRLDLLERHHVEGPLRSSAEQRLRHHRVQVAEVQQHHVRDLAAVEGPRLGACLVDRRLASSR